MYKKFVFLILLLISLVFVPNTHALADGIIVPINPPVEPYPNPVPLSQLVIRYHHVDVTIQDQVAVTHVDQVFYNPNDWTVEGVYVFPIPVNAVVTNFVLWVDGEPIQGEILNADAAREWYEEIVQEMRDPALLEYAGRGAVKMSIYPIPPQGERRIELEYSETLQKDNGLVRYQYPLNTEKFSLQPIEDVSISVNVSSSDPVRAMYSPSHRVDVVRTDDFHLHAGYEQSNVLPDKDFVLLYSVGDGTGLHLLTYKEGELDDGFFLLFLAPGLDVHTEQVSKDVILVLDRSGSMDGEKFQQAQTALKYILTHLNEGDRFNVIAFSTSLEMYAPRLQAASAAGDASKWVEGLGAAGSTDINRALLEAASLADAERPTYLIFLTDGLATEGVVDNDDILRNFANAAKENIRLFAFGVGYDVDTYLLDNLAQEHSGTSAYVLPGERLDEKIMDFYAKISTPVLTDLELDFGKVSVYDVYPNPLPDLFAGSQLILVGRYRQDAVTDIVVSGFANGEKHTFLYKSQNFTASHAETLDVIPKIWATRKIGYLLNLIRLNGPEQEIVDSIVSLSIRYGIVTPYTSFLVTDQQPLGEAARERIAEEEMSTLQMEAGLPTFGKEAVEKAAEQGAMVNADSVVDAPAEVVQIIKNIGAKTYIYNQGVWYDTAYDPEKMETTKVAFLSKAYFELSRSNPQLAAALALGKRVITVWHGKAYEVVESNGDESPEVIKDKDIQATTFPISDVPKHVVNDGNMESGKKWYLCVGSLMPLLFAPFMLIWMRRLI